MNDKNGVVALGFVTAQDVRRYVEDSLPEEDRKDVEQTLLDDERARQLVMEEAGQRNVPPSAATAQKLVSSLDACRQCLVGYELMKSGDGPQPILDFAADSFVKRWSLLKQVRELLKDDSGATEAARDFCEDASEPRCDVPLAIQRAIQQDSTLISKFREAFEAASEPVWKARIAHWMAAIDSDRCRLTWLYGSYR